jgi:hypothetical protein
MPGQYYDAESNLHENWMRFYDPMVGRYVTSDPIGIDGGLNTYAYVDSVGIVPALNTNTYSYAFNNPLLYTDPLGLWPMYGNWGGSNYSGGQSGSSIPADPASPKDALDACYKDHDICYAKAASKSGSSDSASCSAKPTIQDCDRQLAKCTLHVNYKNIGWWGQLFGPASTTWAVFKGELAK